MFHYRVGFSNELIINTFKNSVENKGLYKCVAYLNDGTKKCAYASTNCLEYFASLSVAFFGVNDYFPFNSQQLKEFDEEGYHMCQQMWNLAENELIDIIIKNK